MSGAHAQMRDDPPQQLLVEIADVGWRQACFDADEIDQALGQVAYRHDEVGDAGGDGAARHRGIFGLVRVLYEDDAARLLDGAHADGAVRAGAAQDDREAVAEPFRERAEEQVDRGALTARLVEFQRRNLVIDDLQPAVRRNDVDVVGAQLFACSDLHHGHARARGNDIRQLAAVFRIEMNDDDESGAGVLRQGAEKAL